MSGRGPAWPNGRTAAAVPPPARRRRLGGAGPWACGRRRSGGAARRWRLGSAPLVPAGRTREKCGDHTGWAARRLERRATAAAAAGGRGPDQQVLKVVLNILAGFGHIFAHGNVMFIGIYARVWRIIDTKEFSEKNSFLFCRFANILYNVTIAPIVSLPTSLG